MSEGSFRQIEELFARATEFDPADRERFLQQSGASSDVLQRIRMLLECEGNPRVDAQLRSGFHKALDALADNQDHVPTIFGYDIGERLGKGGFSSVYRARQLEPVNREVAIKVLSKRIVSNETKYRFRRECELLATLNHPLIAKLFDAGTTDDGRPYVVMDCIDGVPLVEGLERDNISERERLRLMISLCETVQHAHLRGVLHGDLKPSNILLVRSDDRYSVRVIDFGISEYLREDPEFDNRGQCGTELGTPAYMSPEQHLGGGRVDLRSDLYSLGIVLHEAVCGSLPTWSGTDIMHHQQVPPELMSVVKRCLHHNPEERYENARAIADDLQGCLDHRPVAAHSISWFYRTRKFIRRNPGTAIAAACVFALIVAATAAIGLQVRETQRESDRAQQAFTFASSLLNGIDPDISQGADRTLLFASLDDASARLRSNPPEDPLVRAEVELLLGRSYLRLSDSPSARGLVESAYALRANLLGLDDPKTLAAGAVLCSVLLQDRDVSAAHGFVETVFDRCVRVLGRDDPATHESATALAIYFQHIKNYERSYDVRCELIEDLERVYGRESATALRQRNELARLYELREEFERSEQAYLLLLHDALASIGEEHPVTLSIYTNYSVLLSQVARDDEILELIGSRLDVYDRVFGKEHSKALLAHHNIGCVYRDRGEYQVALGPLTHAYAGLSRSLGLNHDLTEWALYGLVKLQQLRGKHDEAKQLVAESGMSEEVFTKQYGEWYGGQWP